jgi:hypothetical protein
MEFPRHLHKPGGAYVVCPDAATYDTLKAKGWALLPDAHVEQPKAVRLYDALNAAKVDFDESSPSAKASSVSDLTAKDAEDLIASADAETLAQIKADELAGKARKGVLAMIDVREADLIGD